MADITAQLEGLARERAGYEHDDKPDRILLVDAEIARLRAAQAADGTETADVVPALDDTVVEAPAEEAVPAVWAPPALETTQA